MSFLGDVLDFEKFNGKGIVKGIIKKPTRLLTGVDPASTSLWNGLTGSKDKALVDQMGGATGSTYKAASAAGINTGPGRTMQNIAHVIAAGYATAGLAGAGGAAADGDGLVAADGSTAMGPSAGTLGAADSAGAYPSVGLAGGDATAMGPAAGELGAVDSSSASSGLGLTAGDVSPAESFTFNGAQDSQLANQQLGLQPVTTDDTLNAGSSSGSQSQQQQQQFRQQKQKQQQAQPYSPISGLSEDQYQALVNQATSQIAQSSRKVKTRGATQAALQRGLAGSHPVDTNGVHIAAIQELNKQIEQLGAQIAAVKARRAASKGA